MGHPVQLPCQSRVTYSRLHGTLSRQVLNISREGDSATSLLGEYFQDLPKWSSGCKLHFISTSIKPLYHFLTIHQYSMTSLGDLLIYVLMQVSHPDTVGAASTFKVALPSSLKGEADVPVPHPAFSSVWHAFENKKGSSRQYSPPVHYLYTERRNRFPFR